MSRINAFLELAVKQKGSDLHLVSGRPPRIRINGQLHPVRFRDLSVGDVEHIAFEFMKPEQKARFEEKSSADFAYTVPDLGRFRVNVFRHLDGMAAVLRVIPGEIPTLDQLGLPGSVELGIANPQGLTLVTGPTGSGKTTTLAAIVDHINTKRKGHIITIEDPIEFVHENKSCIVTQKEVGLHAPSFSAALRAALREDPDLILVGEMRDQETISLALTAAETGVQVLGTLHTSGAAKSIDRIINVFDAKRQEQVRTMLADSLRMLVSQRLLSKADVNERVAAAEILINNNAAASVIRSGQTHKLNTVIQSAAKVGMQSLDVVLKDLVARNVITAREAYENALDRGQFERLVARQEAA